MTDEEKAEEYYEDNECYSYLSEVEDFEEVFGFVKDRVIQAYLDGLAEGRKEKCLEQNKDGTIRPCEVMKEHAELSNSVIELTNTKTELESKITELETQIEKMKCCENCIHHHKNETIRVGNNVLCRNGKNQTFKEPCLEWELAE